MSVPIIPGFGDRPSPVRLSEQWAAPTSDYPTDLWPKGQLASIDPNPTGWLTVSQHYYSEESHGGTGCVLVQTDSEAEAIADTTWIGRDLGEVWRNNEGAIHSDGQKLSDGDVAVEFFAQGRVPCGSALAVVELNQSFLWYWDAFPVDGGWRYLNDAGREQDLVRFDCTDDSWLMQVRSLEFRSFLHAYGRSAVMQVDFTYKQDVGEFDRIDDEYSCDWAHFNFGAVHDDSLGLSRPAFSWLIGQYIVRGTRTARLPRGEDAGADVEDPKFIYGVDDATGSLLKHTIDRAALGTYFDKDNSRLHYLTPTYFKREVLQPYANEPGKYRLSVSRLSCLNLWGLDISINTAGLVEAYLGDLGRSLPPDEWGHWLSYNVPPQGEMEQGRFRRDFLNQWASSPDPVGNLQRARQRVATESARRFGTPLWRPLKGSLRDEFQSLIGPLTDDPASLGHRCWC